MFPPGGRPLLDNVNSVKKVRISKNLEIMLVLILYVNLAAKITVISILFV